MAKRRNRGNLYHDIIVFWDDVNYKCFLCSKAKNIFILTIHSLNIHSTFKPVKQYIVSAFKFFVPFRQHLENTVTVSDLLIYFGLCHIPHL